MKNKYILVTLLIFSFKLFGQDIEKKIDETIYKKPLSEVLNSFNIRYGFDFVFDENVLKEMIVSANIKEKTIEETLNTLIGKHFLNIKFYKNKNKQYVIVAANSTVDMNEIWNETKSKQNPTRFGFTLSGVIKDKNSAERLPYASIYVRDKKSIHTLSNVDGYFSLPNIPTDTSTLMISYVGYKNQNLEIKPNSDFNNFTIELESSGENLSEVQVTADKTELVKANEIVGMIKMTPKNIAKLPNVGERDPFRAFQLMPGVSASNESSAGLYVRGGTPDQTLVLYDGFTIYNVDHLFGFFSAFNYNAIKDIQLFKGGFDARFGGRISAVAEITGKQGNSNKLNAGADISLLSANAYIEAPIGNKVSVLLAARRSYKGPLYNKIFEKFTSNAQNQQAQGPFGGGRGGNFGTASQKASSYFYDLNGKLTYQPTKKDIIALSFFNGTDNMDNSSTTSFTFGGRGGGPTGTTNTGAGLSNTTTDLAKWGNTGSSLKWSRNWSQKFYSNALVSYSNYFSNRDNTRNIAINRNGTIDNQRLGRLESNDLTDVSAKIDFEYKVLKNHQLEFGGMFTQNKISFNYTQNDTTTILNRNDKGKIANIYLQDRSWLFDGKLQIIPGLRLTHFDVTKKIYFEPRLSFNYLINQKLKLKGSVGNYYQFVKQINREDISLGNRNFWILADGGQLPVTKSDHIILGGSYETKNYLLDVEFYQKYNSGVSEYTLRFVPQINTPGAPGGPGRGPNSPGLKPSETFFNGTEIIQGVDILLQRKFGNINGWLGYTLAQATRNIAAFSDKPYFSDQDVRHQFKMVAMYKINNFDLAASFIYSTGRPYTSILGAYQITLLDGTTKDFTNPSDKNANRFKNYNRLDLSATYNFHFGSVALSVFNAYNRTNIWYKRFEVIKEQDISYLLETNVTYLGITPNLTLSFKLK